MYYDLKESSNDMLVWAMDILLLRKAEYMEFLDYIQGNEKTPNRRFILEKIWYEEGLTLDDFDKKIEAIQYELDEDYRYE